MKLLTVKKIFFGVLMLGTYTASAAGFDCTNNLPGSADGYGYAIQFDGEILQVRQWSTVGKFALLSFKATQVPFQNIQEAPMFQCKSDISSSGPSGYSYVIKVYEHNMQIFQRSKIGKFAALNYFIQD